MATRAQWPSVHFAQDSCIAYFFANQSSSFEFLRDEGYMYTTYVDRGGHPSPNVLPLQIPHLGGAHADRDQDATASARPAHRALQKLHLLALTATSCQTARQPAHFFPRVDAPLTHYPN